MAVDLCLTLSSLALFFGLSKMSRSLTTASGLLPAGTAIRRHVHLIFAYQIPTFHIFSSSGSAR